MAGLWAWISIPWILILLALPFDDANKFTGGDDVRPVALLAVAPALISMLLVLIAAGARHRYDQRRGGSAPSAA